MRCFALLLVLVLTGCSRATENALTTSPVSTQPALALLSEPAADTCLFGTLYTVGDMGRVAPIAEVKIDRDLNADWAERNGAARVTPKNLEQLLTAGKPVAPGDKLIDAWHYAPWCRATFVAAGRKWSVALYLGGLGVIADDAGRKGAFRFDVPRGDGSSPAAVLDRGRGALAVFRMVVGATAASERPYVRQTQFDPPIWICG